MAAALQIEEVTDQQAFNLARWEEICSDPRYASSPDKIETDSCGRILMSPPHFSIMEEAKLKLA